VPVVVSRGVSLKPPRKELRADASLLVADSEAARCHPGRLEGLATALGKEALEPLLIEGTEASKSADRLPEWWRALRAREVGRDCLIVAAGGGAVLDLAGFLAATWFRGLPHVVVPTTLLSAVDAALGGKTGVNLEDVKNQVGAFKQPRAVLVDPDLLSTLPADVWASGLGEVLKTALLAGGDLLETVRAWSEEPLPESPHLEQVIEGCLRFKASVVANDELEEEHRMILNLGHTVGHVLETLALEQQKPVAHGIAVAAGLRAEVRQFSQDPALLEDVDDLLHIFGMPLSVGVRWDSARARSILVGDKKRRRHGVQVPVLKAPGSVAMETLQMEQILQSASAACVRR
jgi:3-dehydroquinate synthetase